MRAKSKGRVRFSAVVTRADGTVDDYGVVMDTRWNPIKRWLIGRKIKRINKARGV